MVTLAGARCSVLFKDRFYDNLSCGRKGITTLSWPKPKIKFDFKADNVRF